MSTATYDGRSLMLDGRRIWIVSGTLPFACIPAESWADRLHAAKLAGLNTVEVPVPWLACEPRPGVFTFEGQSDINRFLTLAAEAGLRVILRPGPYVGGTMDLGGLPSWLLDNPEIICRGKSPEFLEAVSRFITALAAQVSPLLATAPTPGPVILLQSEHRWTCGDDDLAAAYLGELARYQRESGLGVPVLNANNMWQGLEGQIDAWVGGEGLFAIVRQLGAVRPDQPRIVIGLETGEDTALFEADPAPIEPMEAQRRVAEALASAGQPNLSHAFGSTAFGFLSGSSATGDSRPLASTQQSGSIIDAAGAPTELFGPARRILSFASAFGRLFSHLEPEFRPVVIDPNAEDEERGTPVSVAYASGGQGSVAFVFTDQPGKGRKAPGPVTLLRPEGAAVSVPLGEQRVYWCLFEVLLSGRTMLDYCTLCALTFDETFLVLFGPPGETGELSINGSPLDVTVPKGRKPLVERHEGVTVVVVSEEVVDQTFVTQEGVYVGVASVTADGEPIGSGKAATHVSRDAQVAGASASKPPPAGKATLGQWEAAGCDAYLDGSSPRFASIDGPADMSALGTPHGYGWYRLSLRMGATKRGKVAAPGSGDRLGVYVDAEHAGIIGEGPSADDEITLSLKKGTHTLAVLADNLGRPTSGVNLRGAKGLAGPLWEVAPLKIGKPTLESEEPIDALEKQGPIFDLRRGDVTHPLRVSWTVKHLKKSPLALRLAPMSVRGLLLINGEILRYLEAGEPASILLDDQTLSRGNNTIAFTPINETGDELDDASAKEIAAEVTAKLALIECTNELTAKADWAFAKWEAPAGSAFKTITKAAAAEVQGPTWWRCFFAPGDDLSAPLLDLSGMTKGQVFLNGKSVARYAVAGPDRKALPSARPQPLPASWLEEGSNELMLFDEHGGNPGSVKIVQSPVAPVLASALATTGA